MTCFGVVGLDFIVIVGIETDLIRFDPFVMTFRLRVFVFVVIESFDIFCCPFLSDLF